MTNRARDFAPHARTDGLVVQELPDELLIYDLDRHKAHCLNHTAAVVWKRCDGRTPVRKMARSLERELNASFDEEIVRLALDQLGRSHLLEGWAPDRAEPRMVSRREAMRKMGVAAAVALPLVTSIVAPKAADAATCLPSGAACTSNLQCCSTICTLGHCV